MRKFLLSIVALAASLAASANYNSLEFKFTDGSSQVVDADGLVINVEGDYLNVTNLKGVSLSLAAASLESMQFTDTEAGVSSIIAGNSAVEVFNLQGVSFGKFDSLEEARNNLNSGTYVMKSENGESVKILINK